MKLQIDNLDGRGPQDYTQLIDSARLPQVVRRLNKPSVLKVGLLSNGPNFVVPVSGARLTLGRTNGQDVFSGYLLSAPSYEYLGWGEHGPVYRYNLVAQSDEVALDRKRLPDRVPFVGRSAGNALRQMAQDLLPGLLDVSGVAELDPLASYDPDPQKKFSEHVAEIALEARGSYRAGDGAVVFTSVGAAQYALNESAANFSAGSLTLEPVDTLLNDVTTIGNSEPEAYVTDYFVGDNLTLKFYLSQTPFSQFSDTIFTEEYSGSTLNAALWTKTDPANAVAVSGGKLQIAGGTGSDGQTLINFAEKIEMGGALVMQHGDAEFHASSAGILGGLYSGAVTAANCLAGFQLSPSGTESNIQAIINGALSGTPMTTVSGRHYVLTTRIYSLEVYREQQIFHSSSHPAGSGLGGAELAADVRVVLEAHEIDPANPASLIASSTVLYDDVLTNAPGFATYALINAVNMNCDIAFTRMVQAPGTQVRSALPGLTFRTRLVGAQSDGAECTIVSGPALDFFTAYVPQANEAIEVRYRGTGTAIARVLNPASIAALANGSDDGVRGVVRRIKSPPARMAADCENAALAILDDGNISGWTGSYETWSDFLPGVAADIFPGDALQINMPSRSANFTAIVREVAIGVKDLQGEHSDYKITFANDAAETLSFEFESAKASIPIGLQQLNEDQVASAYLTALTGAAITAITSTTVSIDTGSGPISGGGFEVRWSDTGWGQANDRNLVGRFGTQTFTVPRLSKAQGYFLRQYDASVPPKYSRYTCALYVNYPA
ncbi:MAG TPA: hypothetical protein VGG46_15200 [Terriglobales bacterium]|jgi:hypothetical protein